MKKLLYSGLTALLMLFAFMGGGTAQTLTFNPPSGSSLNEGDEFTVTCSDASVGNDRIWFITYASLTEAQSKARNDFDYWTRSDIYNFTTSYNKFTAAKPVVAAAVTDNEGYAILSTITYAEYTIAGGETPEPEPATPVDIYKFLPASGAEVNPDQQVTISSNGEGTVYYRVYATEAEAKADNASWDSPTNTNLTKYAASKKPVIKENQLVVRANSWLLDNKWDVPSYAVYTLKEITPAPEFTLAFNPDGESNVEDGQIVTITATPELTSDFTLYFQLYQSESEVATWNEGANAPLFAGLKGYSNQQQPQINATNGTVLKAGVWDKRTNKWVASSLTTKKYTIGQREPFVISFDPEAGEVDANTSVTLSVAPALTDGFALYYQMFATKSEAEGATWTSGTADAPDWGDMTAYTTSKHPTITEAKPVLRAAVWNATTYQWESTTYAEYSISKTPEPTEPTVSLDFTPVSGTAVDENQGITIYWTSHDGGDRAPVYFKLYADLNAAKADDDSWADKTNLTEYSSPFSIPRITSNNTVIKAAAWLTDKWDVFSYAEYTIRAPFVISFNPQAGEVEANTSVSLSTNPELTTGFELYYQLYESVEAAENHTWNFPNWEDNLTKYTDNAKPVITKANPILKAAIWNSRTSKWESSTTAEYILPQDNPEITLTFNPVSGTKVNENDTVKIDCSSDEVVVYFMMFDTKAHAETCSDEDWQEGMTEYFEDEEDPSYPVITKAKPVIKAGYGIMDEEENLTWHFFYAEYTVKDNTPSDPTKATVRLVVNGDNCPHLTRNQYQLLLDADHQLADTYAEELKNSEIDRDLLPRLYEAANATIPEGMSANNIAAGVNLYGEASVEVEPGLYDIFLLQSFEASWLEKDIIRGVYVTDGWDRFYVDDLTLQAGFTYTIMVTFDQGGARGELILPVDLKLDAVLGESKPSCELEEMEVSLAISNIGSIDVTQYEILYIVERESKKDTTRETVNATLAAGKDTVVTFSKKCALNAGENTFIHAMVLAQGDANVEDNTGRYIAFRAESAIMPAQIKTTEMHMVKQSDWSLDDNNALVATQNASTPVFSSCFNFEKAGSYRLEYEYICGRYVELPNGEILVNNIDKYRIRLGKSNENWKEWPVVVADSVITGSSNYDEFTSKEVFFQITEPGDYAFCIIPEVVNDKDNLKFRDMQVTAVKDYDARFNALSVRAPRVIPQDWSNATHQLDVAIANRGLNKLENTNIVILVNGNQAATKTVTLDINEKQTLTVDVPVSGFHVGQTITFSGKIVRSEEVLSESGDLKAEVLVSENTAAFDHLTDKDFLSIDIDGLTSYAGARIGLIYPVVKTDTLTAITCGWLEMEENADINIAIQRISVNEDGAFVLGDMIYQSQVRRGLPGGLVTYDIPAFLLTPGDYFISLAQVGRTGFALAMDEHPEGGFYLHDTYEQKWTYFTEAGYPAIRAVFGSNGTLRTKDALVSAISKPIAGGIFANNEPIVVSVRNNGIEKAEIPVYVKVDNTLLEPKTVEVASYATVDLTFNADLAATNADRNILITAFTALSGDEDLSNDTLTKQVISFVPADPYRMDFESCLDFATEGFNPAWTSYSFDGSPVLPLRHVLEGEYHYVDFPGSETDLGFIAFNPLATDPSMIFYEYYNNCRPHSGQRFGASLAITNPNFSKDDWLVSPKLKMPAANTQLSMWVRSFRYLRESYEIWVSEGSGDPMELDFVRVYPEDEYDELKAPIEKWENVVFDLSQYNGKDVHVAIRCMSPDAEMFMIDDIVIGENVANEQTQDADFRLSVYPNPVGEMMMVISPDALIKEVAIFNLSGTLMHHASGLSTENFRYNASGLVSGMYFVRVSTDKGTAVRKFVVR